MTNGKLVLQAPPNHLPIEESELVTRLLGIGLIGALYRDRPETYLAGPKFLQLITFLGCSPHLQLKPPNDGSEDFCHIRMRGPFKNARLLSASNTRPPACPACGKGLTHWRELEPGWSKGVSQSEILCHSCGHNAYPADLNWRRKAGFGHYFIEISEVFPEEAVPLPALMECLRGNGADWCYFYLQQL